MKTTINSPERSGGGGFRSRGRQPFGVQAKSAVSQPGDKYEREADSAASSVVRGDTAAPYAAGAESVQQKPVAESISSYNQMGEPDIPGTEDQTGAIGVESAVQRKESGSEMPDAPAVGETASKLADTKGQGTPLSPETMQNMETGFGADFANVRVHTGQEAAGMNDALAAKAFTDKNDIYFGQGNYDPQSPQGKELLAHELAHTIQQGAAPVKQNDAKAAKQQKDKASPEKKQEGEKAAMQIVDAAKAAPAAQVSGEKKTGDEGAGEPKIGKAPEAEPKDKAAADGKKDAPKDEVKDPAADKGMAEKVDKAIEKEVRQKAPAPQEKKKNDAAPKDEEKKDGAEDGKKEGGDPGPAGVKEDYENPPPVKDAKVEEAVDAAGESVGVDEEANVNVEGLIMTAQQFRDQGKQSVDRAKAQTEHRVVAEKKMKELERKVDGSDKTLGTAEKNTAYREKNLPKIMDKALLTSKQRQQKVGAEVGQYSAEYEKNKGTAQDLKKESGDLHSGSVENSNPEEKESGALSSKYEEMSSGSATMAEGISGAGSTSKKLAADAKVASTKNTSTEKDLNESKANIQKSKGKIASEKARNRDAKSRLRGLTPKIEASKRQEEQLTTEGMTLMKTSFEMENETHRAQYFYYKEMKQVEGSDEMLMLEELREQSEMAVGPDKLIFAYASMKSEGEREAFLSGLSENDRAALGMRLAAFAGNFDGWVEGRKQDLSARAELKRRKKIDDVNVKRNQGLDSPLNKATKNLDKISKTGLLWTSMTKSLENMWEGLKNITWADIGKIGWAMVNPLETFNTVADAVSGIWDDLSDWGGFSKDPVGMILQKGSSVGVKLLTIAGVVTGLLLTLSIVTGVAAVFFPPLWAVVAWLGSATATMTTVTLWIGLITAALSLMSGIKNIYEVHTARSAEEVFQGNSRLKKDAANFATGAMAVVGAKSPPAPMNADKLKNFKNMGVRVLKGGKNMIKGGIKKAPRVLGSVFKKETWTGLYDSFTKFTSKKKNTMFGGQNKIAGKMDNVAEVAPKKLPHDVDVPKKAPKTLDQQAPKPKPKEPEVPAATKHAGADTRKPDALPETKHKPLETDASHTKLKPDADADAPKTQKVDELEVPKTQKVDDPDLPKTQKIGEVDALKNDKLDEVDAPKNRHDAPESEKPPKSDVLGDDPNMKDKDLDNMKKYEDDVDESTKNKMKDEADGEVSKGKNHDSKAKALVMTRMIVAANDKVDTPIPALMAELAPLKAMKGVRGFGYEKISADTFQILMYGSTHKGGEMHFENLRDKENSSEINDKLDESSKKIDYTHDYYHGKKPDYINPGHHDKNSPNFRGGGAGKTEVIPENHEELWKRAIPGVGELNTKQGIPSTWYSIDNKGKIHQFQVDHNGFSHWAGSQNGPSGIKLHNTTRKRLERYYQDILLKK
jgi:hypothetical protein